MINRTRNDEYLRGRHLQSGSRIWTANKQYSRISDCINNDRDEIYNFIKDGTNLRPNGDKLSNSPLQKTGIVKIAPTKEKDGDTTDVKNCMFSIENLAWKDNIGNLSEEQKGPMGGRIMWFPPYNLKFSENVNVNWNGNNFIGRGEQIYTYVNTERSGTLDFTILIDHPSIINKWRGTSVDVENKLKAQEDLLEFFAGGGVFEKDLSSKKNATLTTENNNLNSNPRPIENNISRYVRKFFFPEDFDLNNKDINKINELNFNNFSKPDIIDDFLNTKYNDVITDIYLDDFKNIENFIGRRASIFGDEITNIILFGKKEYVDYIKNLKIVLNNNSYEDISNLQGTTSNEIGRVVLVVLEFTKKNQSPVINSNNDTDVVISNRVMNAETTESNNFNSNFITTIIETEDRSGYKFDNEYLYFSELANTNYNVYKNIVDKIRFFDPAFHSITPEGFNSRLTFLHQCTRQGPTNALTLSKMNEDSKANTTEKMGGNLSFGRAPFGVLRIGDFFNTKICIDSLSIQYDNNGGVQWDLNQEGIGIQPMFANITMNFRFLGGQDLSGPVERLQNAVTSNYYANASVYDKQANI